MKLVGTAKGVITSLLQDNTRRGEVQHPKFVLITVSLRSPMFKPTQTIFCDQISYSSLCKTKYDSDRFHISMESVQSSMGTTMPNAHDPLEL